MSITTGELENLTNARADFELCLSLRDYRKCHAIVDNLGELGYETEALFLFQELNRAKGNDWKHEADIDEAMLRANDDAE